MITTKFEAVFTTAMAAFWTIMLEGIFVACAQACEWHEGARVWVVMGVMGAVAVAGFVAATVAIWRSYLNKDEG